MGTRTRRNLPWKCLTLQSKIYCRDYVTWVSTDAGNHCLFRPFWRHGVWRETYYVYPSCLQQEATHAHHPARTYLDPGPVSSPFIYDFYRKLMDRRAGSPYSKFSGTFQCPGTSLRISVDVFRLCLSTQSSFPPLMEPEKLSWKGIWGRGYKITQRQVLQTSPGRPCFHVSMLLHLQLLLCGEAASPCLLRNNWSSLLQDSDPPSHGAWSELSRQVCTPEGKPLWGQDPNLLLCPVSPAPSTLSAGM